MKNLNQIEFLERVKIIHRDSYDYSETVYKNNRAKINVVCLKHGRFSIIANSLLSGQGCNDCGKEMSAKTRTQTVESFIKKSNSVHNNFYLYQKTKYINSSTKVTITCPIHGDFTQLPSNHKTGQRCPLCAKDTRHGFKKNSYINNCKRKGLDAKLYLIKMFNEKESFVKIGITSTSISKRIGQVPYNYIIIKTLEGCPEYIWDLECRIHRQMKKYSYKPLNCFKGHTECYGIKNINQLIKLLDNGI